MGERMCNAETQGLSMTPCTDDPQKKQDNAVGAPPSVSSGVASQIPAVALGGVLCAMVMMAACNCMPSGERYVEPPAWANQSSRHPGLPHFQVGARPSLHLGEHLIIEMWGVDHKLLATVDQVKPRLEKACAAGRFTVLERNFHGFAPHGVTAVFLLAESHMSIHTWPEHGYAAIDVFTCGVGADTTTDIWKAAATLKDLFGARSYEVRRIERGMPKEQS